MYGGAHGLTVSCLLASQKHLLAAGHEVVADIVSGGSILPKVRNGIVKRFLDSDADVLVFIDSDMVWEPGTLQKLVETPFDVSVANYRKRNNEVTYLAIPATKDGEHVGTTHNGDIWLQAELAGTGLMAIRRKTLEEMVLKYPTLEYTDNGESTPCLFNFELENGRYYGEDYTFCRKLSAIGGQIFILADAYVGHVGTTVYGGNYHEYLLAQRG
jgi:hypothetical protein